jgi:hypothetical protein
MVTPLPITKDELAERDMAPLDKILVESPIERVAAVKLTLPATRIVVLAGKVSVVGDVKAMFEIVAELMAKGRLRTKVKDVPAVMTGEKAVSVVSDVAEAMAVMVLVWPEAVIESPTKWIELKEVPVPVTVVPELEIVPVPACEGELMPGENAVSIVSDVADAMAVMTLVWPAEMTASPTL